MKNFGLVELNAQEVREVEGGFAILEAIIAVVTIGSYLDYAAGEFVKGWNHPR